MKKTIEIILILTLMILLVGCSSGAKENNQVQNIAKSQEHSNSNIIETDAAEEFEVNKIVFEDEIIQVTCKKITSSSIVFDIQNKTDLEIEWVNINVSLDGVQIPFYANNSSDQNISGKEVREVEYIGEIGSAEHQYLGLVGNTFINGSSKGEIDVCNFDLGGSVNDPDIDQGKLVYEDDIVAVYYNAIEINSIQFCIVNKLDRAISAGFWGVESLTINDKQYSASVTSVAGKSSVIYDAYLGSDEDDNIQITHIESFQGVFGVKENNTNEAIEDASIVFSEE